MRKSKEQGPVIEERDGQLFFVHKDVRLVLHKTSLMRSMDNCKEVSASTAQRLLATFNMEMPLTTPHEIYAPLVMSFVQIFWYLHFFGVVDSLIVERHEKRLDRYRHYLISGKMPEILTGKKKGVLQQRREKLYIVKPGTAPRGGQLGLVLQALMSLGPSTVAQITAEVIRLGLRTTQSVERVVRYYVVTRFNKEIINAATNEVREDEGAEEV